MKDLSIGDFSYDLPEDRIAHSPLAERDSSKLLIYRNGEIIDDQYRNIAGWLPEDSLLVFNNSRVIEARLIFTKDSGARIEVFCLAPHEKYPDITTALGSIGSVSWICLVGGASKWKQGQVLKRSLTNGEKTYSLTAEWIEKRTDAFVIALSWDAPEMSFAEVLHHSGATPLPPYIRREAAADDAERYQTIYADEKGSVAAPTAGLHFTTGIMESVARKNIRSEFLTLHVGAGTFKPVKAITMEGHEMHAEYIEVSIDSLLRLTEFANRYITAVGTTSVRTLETLYWLGIMIETNPELPVENLVLGQWFAFENMNSEIAPAEALRALSSWMSARGLRKLITRTSLLIGPGYKFRLVNSLVTNFHQPKSTLLLLVAALAGDGWKEIYRHALASDYRFLSYGDGCLILQQP